MTSKYMNFSPQLVNERNAALNNCPTKSGRSQIYKNYYIKMKDAYKKYEEAIEDDEEDYEDDEEDDDDDEDYEPSEDEEYEEEYEASEADTSEADTSECETEDASEADQEYEASECEQEVPDQDTNACETEADQEYCCCCEAAYACETEEASEAADEVEASEAADEAGACETEEADENEFGCPGCNYEWRDGYKNGWKDAMKYIAGRTHKEVPDTPACSYCDIVCKTRKCGGKCGGVVRYCSVDCQKQDWAFGHKNICCK
jgi:hypothetical protein